MNTLKTLSLLEKVIDKGGLLGKAGKLYTNDVQKADQFLKECAAQCHIKGAIDYWGNDLVAELIAYAQGN
ncbi:MAG: hypothetical protein HY062_01650 [Bacteroidetes bacterium]|nr:hypothetical protein [Bacteroidota bacterium]